MENTKGVSLETKEEEITKKLEKLNSFLVEKKLVVTKEELPPRESIWYQQQPSIRPMIYLKPIKPETKYTLDDVISKFKEGVFSGDWLVIEKVERVFSHDSEDTDYAIYCELIKREDYDNQ